jgi:hypothetical protein
MRVALAQDGNEPKDKALHAEALAICFYERFTAKFRRGIERCLNRKRRAFRRRKNFRLSINRPGGGERDTFRSGRPHALEHVDRREGVLMQILGRVVGSETHIRIRGQMKNELAAIERRRQRLLVEQIPIHEPKPLIRASLVKKPESAGGEIIVTHHMVPQGEQSIRQSATDEPGTTGYKTPQIKLRSITIVCRKCSL